MNKHISIFTKAILAGILIGLAGAIYLSIDNNILGAFLFGFGLLVILANGYNLYTGKIGYLIDRNAYSAQDILIIILGNFVGTGLVALFIHFSAIPNVILQAEIAVAFKLSHSLPASFFLSIFCGMLMYLAANGYRNNKNEIAKVTVVFCAVMIFILAKFEHSIANMFYFPLSKTWSLNVFVYFVVMIVGNAVGAFILNGLEKVAKYYEEDK